MATQKPKDVLTSNGWYLEWNGIRSPHFQTLTGLRKSTGKVEVVDGGSNIRHKFNSQIKDFGSIQLSRPMDGTVIDDAVEAAVNASIDFGAVYGPVSLVKNHNGAEAFRIVMDGVSFHAIGTDFNMEDAALMQALEASVNEWYKLKT